MRKVIKNNNEEVFFRHQNDAKVAFMGDTHGDTGWVMNKIIEASRAGVSLLFSVGDFGFWPGRSGEDFIAKVNERCREYGVDIVVTLGNHEDYATLNSLWNLEENTLSEPLKIREHIFALPRPYRFNISGRSFVSLGGAASVDYDHLTPYVNWWPEEMLTQEMLDETVALGYADVMITHESPGIGYAVPFVDRIITSNPMGFSEAGTNYGAESTAILTMAFEGVHPRVLIHGHMHVSGTKDTVWDDGTVSTVISLANEHKEKNMSILDLTGVDFSANVYNM